MKTISPEVKHIHHDTSLSSFATGLFIGTLATLVLATEEGRAAGKKLIDALKETSRELSPELEKIPGKINQVVNTIEREANSTFNPLDRLHRGSEPTSSFRKGGQSLR